MNLVPEHRALFGVDVVGSASNPGYHLNAVHEGVQRMVSAALCAGGVDRCEVIDWESTGDGVLLTLPSRNLGALLDSTQHLDAIASTHNRQRKPEMRYSLAVEVGPVGDTPGFCPPKIALNRLLEAPEFKNLFARCRQEGDEDAVHTALIVSDQAIRAAFGGDHTSLLRRGDFASLTVRNKEYVDTAWARVPGFDARSLTAFAAQRPQEVEASSAPQVSNVVYGNQNGIQSHTINGGITFGVGPR